MSPGGLPHGIRVEVTTPHLASPGVKVEHKNRQIEMYFHGLERLAYQVTRMALSWDGINFVA